MSYLLSIVMFVAEILQPIFSGSATAVAIVFFTVVVRLLLHPLSRAAVRGEKDRAAVAPQMAELRRKYGNDRERMTREIRQLYETEGASPVAGCLPMVLQLPVFFLMYQLFTTTHIGGAANSLLTDTLAGVPLGSHLADALVVFGFWGPVGLVYGVLFSCVALVAWWTYRRTKRTMAAQPTPEGPAATISRIAPWLSFGTVFIAAVVPLAAALYLLTTMTWTVAERAWLQRV